MRSEIAPVAVLLSSLAACIDPPPPSTRPARPDATPIEIPATGNPFDDANLRIFGYDEASGTAFGNTEYARDMAERFNEVMTTMEALAFTGGAPEGRVSLTRDHFITHCEHREGKVAFLVHVPQLKNYRDDVREVLLQIAWVAASDSVAEACPSCEVAVGLRGAMFYGAVATGTATTENPSVETGDVVPDDALRRFFTGPEAEIHAVNASRGPEAPREEVMTLMASLKSDTPKERIAAIRALGELEGDIGRAVPDLRSILENDKHGNVRAAAVTVLADKEGARAMEEIERALELGQWAEVSFAAAHGLLKCGPAGKEALRRQLRESPWTHTYVAAAIETVSDEEAREFIPVLRFAAGRPDSPMAQATAFRVLGRTRDVASMNLMIQGLESTIATVRAAAATGLTHFGPDAAEAVPHLDAALDKASTVPEREAIEGALAAIRGTNEESGSF